MIDATSIRIERLESQLAYQELAIDELTRSLELQRQELVTLTALLVQLRQQFKEGIQSPVAEASAEQPPPHY